MMPTDIDDAHDDTDSDSSSDFNISQLIENKEDIELYRQIHAQYSSTEKPIVKVTNQIVPRHFGTAAYRPVI